MKQLYQLYDCHFHACYKEAATEYVLTMDNLADVFASEDFILDIESYSFGQTDYNGYVQIIITHIEYDGELCNQQMTLVPVKGFL